jgi:hypothetical protein
MYVYAELGLRVSEGSNASRKYVLESGKSLERVRSSGVNMESSGIWNPLTLRSSQDSAPLTTVKRVLR